MKYLILIIFLMFIQNFFLVKTNTVKNIVKYTSNIKPKFHCLCSYKDIIYIVDGAGSVSQPSIISFNPSTKVFNKLDMKLPKLGKLASCIEINGLIHI